MAADRPVALEGRGEGADGRRYSPSAARNREPIRDVLKEWLGRPGSVLEIASGTGEHGVFMVEAFEGLEWTFSDVDPASLQSQAAWRSADTTGRLLGPLEIDASARHWGTAEQAGGWDAIFSANMIHIAPFEAAQGLFAGAGRLLKTGGLLILYGPFSRSGVMAPSNAVFDQNLKSRDPSWGVRDLDRELMLLAREAGLGLAGVADMPANNLTVIFRKD